MRDGVGGLYAECARRGELITLGRHTVDVAALDRFGRPARIVADRWREADLREALDAAGVPLAALELRGMGFRDGAEDVRGFRKACADRRVVPAPSLLLRSAMAEARTVSDPSANAKLSKGSQGGRRARARDDAAAAILAVAAGVRTPLAPRRRWRGQPASTSTNVPIFRRMPRASLFSRSRRNLAHGPTDRNAAVQELVYPHHSVSPP